MGSGQKSNTPANRVRRGRPVADSDTVRRKRVVTLLTQAEFAALERLAEGSDESMSAACRRIIASYLALQLKENMKENMKENVKEHADRGEGE